MKERRAFGISINLLILISWVMMMAILIKKEGMLTTKKVESNFRELIPQDIEMDTWKSLYISDQWIGYVHMTMGSFQEGKSLGYLINGMFFLRFKMFEQLQEIEINSVQVLDSAFRLRKFEARISGMTYVLVTGKRLGNYMLTEIRHGNTKYKKVFDATDDLFLENSILSIYRGKGLKVGDKYTLNLFNPITLSTETAHVKVVGKKDDLLLLETKLGGLSSKTWIDKKGQVVRENAANGWVMVLETKEEIERHMKKIADKGVDILTEAAVKTTKKLDNPRKLGFLRIKVSGIDFKDFPFDDMRQRLIDQEKGIVEIRAISPDEKEIGILPYKGKELWTYLKPSIWIQNRDPKIQSQALQIIGDETNSWFAAKKIGQWVHDNIQKSFSVGIPVATSVLLNREGDCNEHAVLFVALARACGIPADICAGFIFIEDGFYYHAWPKVYVGKWVHLDPTLGQTIADATHFELVSGDFSAQAKLALTMGKIDIEILDAKTLGENI